MDLATGLGIAIMVSMASVVGYAAIRIGALTSATYEQQLEAEEEERAEVARRSLAAMRAGWARYWAEVDAGEARREGLSPLGLRLYVAAREIGEEN